LPGRRIRRTFKGDSALDRRLPRDRRKGSRKHPREESGEQTAQEKTANHTPAPLVTRKSHDVSAIVQKFMQIMAGDERRRALFGANEIDDKESQNTGECGPKENLAGGDWNRPGCRSMDKAAHVLPHWDRSLALARAARKRKLCTNRAHGEGHTLGAVGMSVNAARAWAKLL
jgi:hypothetical protein